MRSPKADLLANPVACLFNLGIPALLGNSTCERQKMNEQYGHNLFQIDYYLDNIFCGVKVRLLKIEGPTAMNF